MPATLTALLCLGLCLSQRISTQKRMYDTPTLSVHPGPTVFSGEYVTFYCRLETATSTFFLLKEGRSSHIQNRYGNTQAEFPVGPVTTGHKGTYRCFGSYNNHAWSFPSEPVELLVADLVLRDHTAQNLLRIGLSFLVLVALAWFLAEDWLSRKRTRGRAKSFALGVQEKAENTTL
ncbi:natural cytotoxicity triggering receptor 1 isoform d precursor, partial [Daubentonia madagascariensis]